MRLHHGEQAGRGTIYTGVTSNLARRAYEHRSNLLERIHKPVRLPPACVLRVLSDNGRRDHARKTAQGGFAKEKDFPDRGHESPMARSLWRSGVILAVIASEAKQSTSQPVERAHGLLRFARNDARNSAARDRGWPFVRVELSIIGLARSRRAKPWSSS